MGWFVLNKYYALTDETPAYAAALLLDPSKRLKYIQHNWDIGWIDSVVEKTRMFWEENYKDSGPVGGTSLSAKDESPYSRRPRNDLDALFDEITVWEESNPDVDDFDTLGLLALLFSGGLILSGLRRIHAFLGWLLIFSRSHLNQQIQNQHSPAEDGLLAGIEKACYVRTWRRSSVSATGYGRA